MRARRVLGRLDIGIRTAVRDNIAAYGFSLMITASFGLLTAALGSPAAWEIFLFLAGGVGGVVFVEALASRGFREQMRGEPSEVVVLGNAFSFMSAGAAAGIAALTGEVLTGWPGWPLGAFLAAASYVVLSGVELALAHEAAEGD